MKVWLVLVLAAVAYAFRWTGLTLLRGRELPSVVRELLRLVPVALIGGLVLAGTFTTDGALVLDARVLGVAIAAVLAWRGMPPLIVFVTGVGVVGLFRVLTS